MAGFTVSTALRVLVTAAPLILRPVIALWASQTVAETLTEYRADKRPFYHSSTDHPRVKKGTALLLDRHSRSSLSFVGRGGHTVLNTSGVNGAGVLSDQSLTQPAEQLSPPEPVPGEMLIIA